MKSYQFRSEPMALCQLILQTDAAFNCLSELGELGMVQFKDLNSDKSVFQRKYINEVRRCEALERIINFLTKEICKRDIPIPNDEPSPPAAHERVLADYETKLEQLEKEVKTVNNSLNLLTKNFLELTELKHLLRKTQSFFDQVEGRHEGRHVLEPYYPPARATVQQSQSSSAHSYREVEGFAAEHDFQDRAGPASTDDDDLILFDSLMGGSSFPLRGRQAGASSTHPATSIPLSSVHSFRLRFIAGVIARERLTYFEKMLFRVSHGNVLLKYSDIDTPLVTSVDSDKQVYKTVFLAFFQGEQLKSKILKICEGFHASVYPCPDSQSARREMAMGVMTRLEDLNIVMNQTQEHQTTVLVGAAQRLWTWSVSIMKTKSIYHTMNMFSLDFTRKSLVGECWCPAKELNSIQINLRVGTEKSEVSESSAILHRLPVSSEDPPTYNRANKILDVFQNIVDAYGVSSYMEINPAVFSVITFPFLFSLMFGDLGHGLILAMFGLLLIFGENRFHPKLRNHEVVKMILTGKYMILMMGIFSMHSGLIYNDCFAKPVKIFGTQWSTKLSIEELAKLSHLSLNPNSSQFTGESYPFGMDPAWQLAENKITWLNSFKMKISVVFGVLHMLFGVILSLFNHRFFNNRLNIICEFVPQMIFLIFTFGYLVALIFHKWIAYDATMSNEAPSLLIGFINMFLMTYPDEPANAVVSPAKKGLQIFLLLSALMCVPWMLLSKPLILRRRAQHHIRQSLNGSSVAYHRQSSSRRANRSTNHMPDEDLLLLGSDDDNDDESQFNESALSTQQRASNEGSRSQQIDQFPISQFDFGEVFITQCIHTIEYCLGCISHTASYLRLWALSLAHAQLSEVLWKMIFHLGLTLGAGSAWGAVFIFFFFPPWAFLTIVILLCMEGLSAFLHTLRLHWIEFMSKFFVGSGRLFDPFSFKSIDLPASDD